MATRPVISIDLDDSAFQRFLSLFKSYTEKLDEQPEVWAKINDAMGGASKSLESGAISGKEALALAAAQAGVIAEAMREATKVQNEFGRSVNKSGKGMETLAKSAKGVGSAISAVAGGILKIAAGLGLGALLGGLGIGELTDAAFSRIRSAGQLGISPGQLASFSVNAPQFLTPSAISAAANARNDLGSIGNLGLLGVSPGERESLSAPGLAFKLLSQAAAAYRTNPSMAKQLPAVSAYLALGGQLGDVRNAAMHPRAFAAAQANYRADIQALNISREEGRAWAQLKIKMDLAGQTIQTALISKLSGLAPKIAVLATDVAGFITTVLGSKNMTVVLKDVESGLKSLGDFLASPQFTTDLHDFGTGIGSLAAVMRKLWPKDFNAIGTGGKHGLLDKTDWENTTGAKQIKAAQKWLEEHVIRPLSSGGMTSEEIFRRRAAGDYTAGRIHALNTLSEAKHKLPKGILDRLAMDESGYGRSLISPAGALGVAQFMPGTAKGYGINPLSTRQSTDAAGKMLGGLFAKYGSWDKAVAAYNWGGGNLDEDIRKHGADWLKYAPKETQGEVRNVVGSNASSLNADVAKMLGRHIAKAIKTAPRPTHIVVTNHTAARVSVSANAAAQGQ